MPYCLKSICYGADGEVTLMGKTSQGIQLISSDSGHSWISDTGDSFGSLDCDSVGYAHKQISNESPSEKGNDHSVPDDSLDGSGSDQFWLTNEELCVWSDRNTKIYCSKWWCDCV
jgi:hypothetical protein